MAILNKELLPPAMVIIIFQRRWLKSRYPGGSWPLRVYFVRGKYYAAKSSVVIGGGTPAPGEITWTDFKKNPANNIPGSATFDHYDARNRSSLLQCADRCASQCFSGNKFDTTGQRNNERPGLRFE